mmetsp:Transcript_610/g.1761  ORF Transcript_610/g.1761 Transcript_610/m.1761 type:complete len:224 (+) Transcript_610:560-1231(+)
MSSALAHVGLLRGLLPLGQLRGAVGSGANGPDVGATHARALQLRQAIDGGPARGSHAVLEHSWVRHTAIARSLKNHFGSANDRLCCQSEGLLARQSRCHSAISHGLQHLEHVSRPTAGQPRCRVHHVLIDAHSKADGGHEELDLLLVLGGGVGAHGEGGGGLANGAGGVGHHTHHPRPLRQLPLQRLQRDPGGDGDHEVAVLQKKGPAPSALPPGRWALPPER